MAHGRIYGPASYVHVKFGGAPIVAATVNLGDITVSNTPPASGVLTISTEETIATTPIAIPAGAYRVYIKNVGSLVEGGASEDITINGQDFSPGEEYKFEAVLDPALGTDGTYKTLPLITILNPSGAGIWYRVER